MSTPDALVSEWRDRADHFRDLGADAQAQTLEWCAERLEEPVRRAATAEYELREQPERSAMP